jgi:hypothetical protein
LNGWHTDRRYQIAPPRSCVLDHNCSGEDSLEHYAGCEHHWDALSRIHGVETLRSKRNIATFLQLESRRPCKYRMAHVYAVMVSVHKLRHRSHRSLDGELLTALRARYTVAQLHASSDSAASSSRRP